MVDDDEAPPEKKKRYTEFECPDCDASNPYDDGFGDGDEVRCFYCGQLYVVQVTDSGRLKFKEA
ncbi:MAG: hypothetical protein D6729_18915 [Deltaproteobacteria bacterium]|nr:MAG: hypothetical protein D6729_18915 [Deltaproteobacteria bacterium]